jgi:hypothetical protein
MIFRREQELLSMPKVHGCALAVGKEWFRLFLVAATGV